MAAIRRPKIMLAFLALLPPMFAPLPDKAAVGFSGIPQFSGGNVVIVSHTVTLNIAKDHVDVSSTTLLKNNGSAGAVSVQIPVAAVGGVPTPSGMTASWANAPISLTPSPGDAPTSFMTSASMQDRGSYALRIQYTQPLGSCGMDGMRRLVAYGLSSPVPIGTLMVSYAYAPDVVFHLPDMGPTANWQVGRRGAYLRRNRYDGKMDLSFCAFYPAGFSR